MSNHTPRICSGPKSANCDFSEKYYIAIGSLGDGNLRYLHTDGVWRESTFHNNRYTGYFDTKRHAEDTLKKYHPPI